MNNTAQQTTLRLQRLRVAVKLMLGGALLVCTYVLFSAFRSGQSTAPAIESLVVDLAGIAAGEMSLIDWDGRPVLVLHRSAPQIAMLTQPNPQLRDPDSTRSTQPDFAHGATRSQHNEWFVAIALGTDFNCIVEPVDRVPSAVAGVVGAAGLRDTCRGSYYDLAGRVFAGQYADRNLSVPRYRINDQRLSLLDAQ